LPSIEAAASLKRERIKQKVWRLFISEELKIIPSYKISVWRTIVSL
jgi:hypothetical protein